MNLRTRPEPTEEEIQTQAYLLYVESGRTPHRDLENWFAAKELLLRCAHPPKRRGKQRSALRLHYPASEASQQPWTSSSHR